MEKKLAVLVSGNGTNLEAIIKSDISVSLVIADQMCWGIELAHEHDIPSQIVRRLDYSNGAFNRFEYTKVIRKILLGREIDLVMMAGFMTILDRCIFDSYEMKVLNTHPSLLPAFQGKRAVRDALAAGVKITGCTLHYATERLDDDRFIVDQRSVPVYDTDTETTLHRRIKAKERIMVPENLRLLLR